MKRHTPDYDYPNEDPRAYSWLGRRPHLAIWLIYPALILYLIVAAVDGMGEGYRAWIADLHDLTTRLSRRS